MAAADAIPEVEVLLSGLLTQPGVEGFLVFNEQVPLRWSPGFVKPGALASASPIPTAVVHNTALAYDLARKAKATCKTLMGEEGKLALMRLRTHTGEIVIAPAETETLMVLQKAHSAVLMPLVKLAEQQAAAAAAAANAAGSRATDKGARR